MNAIVKISGKQYNVEKDTKLFVDKLQEKEGAKVKFDDVLMVDNGKDTKISYREVHKSTLTNDVQYFPPQERVY